MRITAIVGSYRKGGIVDRIVDEILEAAAGEGAETSKVYLVDRRIEFCSNCRACTQEPGEARGDCVVDDDVASILDEVEASEALVLASPVNFGTVTAVTKRFLERLICYAHWPWGAAAPRGRVRGKPRRAVVVSASQAPALLTRVSTGIVRLLKNSAGLLGARTVGVVLLGLAARRRHQELPARTSRKARSLGRRLASGR